MPKTERLEPIRKSGFSPDSIPPEIVQCIGEIVAHWSYVEFQLTVLIREGFNVSRETGNALIGSKGLEGLCGTLRTLAHTDKWIADDEIRGEIQSLANDVQANKGNRHEYAHGVFGFYNEETGELYQYLTKKREHKAKPGTKLVVPDELRALANEARNLGTRAQNLTVRVKGWKQSAGLRRPT